MIPIGRIPENWVTTGWSIGPNGDRISLGYVPGYEHIVQPAEVLEEYEEK